MNKDKCVDVIKIILDQMLQDTALMKPVLLMMKRSMDIKQYFIPQMKQLQEKTEETNSKKRSPSNRQTTNAETSLNETNTDSTIRTLPRRSERQRKPLDKYAITISR